MKQAVNLLEGKILYALSALALPIMATSLIQMAYNLTDMIWIGKIGSGAVAAIGAAGMLMWFSNGLATIAKMGGQIKVAQALGAGSVEKAQRYATASFQLAIGFAIGFGLLTLCFGRWMIDFFRLHDPQVIEDAYIYLMITCGLVIFSFLNQLFSGTLTAMGNSRISFQVTTIGLIANIVLDPMLIFGWGMIPPLGVTGAALATIIAQALVSVLFFLAVRKEDKIFAQMHLFQRSPKYDYQEILLIGLPTALQSMLFSAISMVLARQAAMWGDGAVAVQKVGSQIESISWMSAEGYAAALNSFVAQNCGAGNIHRIKQGYRLSMTIMLVWGLFCSILLIVWPDVIFRIFIDESAVFALGIDYLRILGVSQLFMCIEITTAGAFNGLGKTLPPSIVSITFTAARIPMAYLLGETIGLNGIWWAITISSVFKGTILLTWFILRERKASFFTIRNASSAKEVSGKVT